MRLPRGINDAGAIFIGRYTPEVIGDYVAGTNHVLPTARSARFASGLGVLDFMKRTSILKLDAEQPRRARARRHGARRGRRARRASPLRRHQAQSEGLGHGGAGRGAADWPEAARLIEVTLDEASIGRNNAEVEHEREVAIFDLLEKQLLRARRTMTAAPTRSISRSPTIASCSPSAIPSARRSST